MLNRYTKVKIQCPRRPRSKVAGSSPAQHRTIPHSELLLHQVGQKHAGQLKFHLKT